MKQAVQAEKFATFTYLFLVSTVVATLIEFESNKLIKLAVKKK